MFKYDLSDLKPNFNKRFSLIGAKFETLQDYYFRAKQRELLERYTSARMMLGEIQTDDWNHWTRLNKDEEAKEICKLMCTSYFYESALFFYNIVVELSWAIVYITLEMYLINDDKGIRESLDGLKEKVESIDILRELELLVKEPSSESFSYLESYNRSIHSIIALIREFKEIDEYKKIKELYNFSKHRGKIKYTELEKYENYRTHISFSADESGKVSELISSSADLFKKVNLSDEVNKLLIFDNEILYPHIKKLLELLEITLNISPFAL